MYVIRETNDLLIIHSPATASRTLYSIMMAIGAALTVVAAISLAIGLIGLIGKLPIADYLGGAACFGVIGVFLGGIGWFGFRWSHDKDFRFDGKTASLTARWEKGKEAIPFTRIIRADVFDDGSDSAAFVLRLRMRDPAEELQLNDRRPRDDVALNALAGKINDFLNAFRPPSVDLADADALTMAKEFISNLWHGGAGRAMPPNPSAPPACGNAASDKDGTNPSDTAIRGDT